MIATLLYLTSRNASTDEWTSAVFFPFLYPFFSVPPGNLAAPAKARSVCIEYLSWVWVTIPIPKAASIARMEVSGLVDSLQVWRAAGHLGRILRRTNSSLKKSAVVRNFHGLPSKRVIQSCKDKVLMEWEKIILCPSIMWPQILFLMVLHHRQINISISTSLKF